jgi:hypothetical protein
VPRRRLAPAPSEDGSQSLGVLHDAGQVRLDLHLRAASLARSIHSVTGLGLGKGVLTADVQLSAGRVAARRVQFAHTIPRPCTAHLLPALLLRQIKVQPRSGVGPVPPLQGLPGSGVGVLSY